MGGRIIVTPATLNSERAAHRAKRTAAAFALPLIKARDQRARGRHGTLQRHRAARIAADALTHLVHPAAAFAALLADRGTQCRLDRAPMLNLLARQAERRAQARDLAFGDDNFLSGCRYRPNALLGTEQRSHHRER